MYLAISKDGNRIEATKEEGGYCPSCQKALIAKMGEIYVWHWSHKKGEACDYRKNTSNWLYRWLSQYHKLPGWQVEYDNGGVNFDAYCEEKKMVMKFMKSLNLPELREHLDLSLELGLSSIVVFHSSIFRSYAFRNHTLHKAAWRGSLALLMSEYERDIISPKPRFFWDLSEAAPDGVNLEKGLYKLGYDKNGFNQIAVSRTPKARSNDK